MTKAKNPPEARWSGGMFNRSSSSGLLGASPQKRIVAEAPMHAQAEEAAPAERTRTFKRLCKGKRQSHVLVESSPPLAATAALSDAFSDEESLRAPSLGASGSSDPEYVCVDDDERPLPSVDDLFAAKISGGSACASQASSLSPSTPPRCSGSDGESTDASGPMLPSMSAADGSNTAAAIITTTTTAATATTAAATAITTITLDRAVERLLRGTKRSAAAIRASGGGNHVLRKLAMHNASSECVVRAAATPLPSLPNSAPQSRNGYASLSPDAVDLDSDDGSSSSSVASDTELVSFFNSATKQDLQEATSCTDAQACIVLSLKPFDDIEHLTRLLRKTKGVSPALLARYWDLRTSYSAVDALIRKAEQMGSRIQEMIAEFHCSANDASIEQPEGLASGYQMTQYQLVGAHWLEALFNLGVGCILADEVRVCACVRARSGSRDARAWHEAPLGHASLHPRVSVPYKHTRITIRWG